MMILAFIVFVLICFIVLLIMHLCEDERDVCMIIFFLVAIICLSIVSYKLLSILIEYKYI